MEPPRTTRRTALSLSFHDASVATYLQGVTALVSLLDRARTHFPAAGIEALTAAGLHPDMRPLRFQIRSVAHHSRGALEGLRFTRR